MRAGLGSAHVTERGLILSPLCHTNDSVRREGMSGCVAQIVQEIRLWRSWFPEATGGRPVARALS
jgi:hypothetical protein